MYIGIYFSWSVWNLKMMRKGRFVLCILLFLTLHEVVGCVPAVYDLMRERYETPNGQIRKSTTVRSQVLKLRNNQNELGNPFDKDYFPLLRELREELNAMEKVMKENRIELPSKPRPKPGKVQKPVRTEAPPKVQPTKAPIQPTIAPVQPTKAPVNVEKPVYDKPEKVENDNLEKPIPQNFDAPAPAEDDLSAMESSTTFTLNDVPALKPIVGQCRQQFPYTDKTVVMDEAMDVNIDERQVECYIKCVFVAARVMDNKGKIEMSGFINGLKPVTQRLYGPTMIRCQNIVEDPDQCTKAYKMYQCFRNDTNTNILETPN